jgi:hypothetical protein
VGCQAAQPLPERLTRRVTPGEDGFDDTIDALEALAVDGVDQGDIIAGSDPVADSHDPVVDGNRKSGGDSRPAKGHERQRAGAGRIFGEEGSQVDDGLLDNPVVGDGKAAGPGIANGGGQPVKTFIARGDGGQHVDAQAAAKFGGVNGNAARPGLVLHVERKHKREAHLH